MAGPPLAQCTCTPCHVCKFAAVDSALARAKERGRPYWSQRSLVREAACALDHVGKSGPRRFYTSDMTDDLQQRAGSPETSAAWLERYHRFHAMFKQLAAWGYLQPSKQ
ncbi:uncharacterized protein J3D65DRAFT_668272 [Phyllosticta citribraziliensis]|uniref:Uncharacterized protein n=1 Tax=Phyllosticta citribraziliensis TaxID=989973 RepID=A0ABR1LKR3_9PEZI